MTCGACNMERCDCAPTFPTEQLNIYLVTRVDSWTYDDYDSMVVAAESEEVAKTISPNRGQDFYNFAQYKFCGWVSSPVLLTVTFLGHAGKNVKPGLILASYNAG